MRKIINKFYQIYLEFLYKIDIGLYTRIGKKAKIKGKGVHIQNNVKVAKHAWIQTIDSYNNNNYSGSINIKQGVVIGNYVCITSIKNIEIEEDCLLSEYVYISDHGHKVDPSAGRVVEQDLESKGEVIIGKNTFIGYRATILGGVILGNNCVVGSHSVVNKSFPPYSMVAGVPAKLIKTYDLNLKKWVSVL